MNGIAAAFLLAATTLLCLILSAALVPSCGQRGRCDMTPQAPVKISSRRDALALAVTALVVPPAIAVEADPRATITLHLESPEQRAGLELFETSIGTPPRPVVAIKRILPDGMGSRNVYIQPGMLVKDYADAKSVLDRIKNGPYPIDLKLYNLAAGGDAFGNLGKTLVTAQDALQMARDTAKSSEDDSTAVDKSKEGFVARVTRAAPASCGFQSRRGDVLEIEYEAHYGSPDGPMYDSSAQRGTGQPYQFVLGSGDMIPGVDLGLYDMCPGEGRDLEIPPALAYGDRGSKLFEIPGGQRLYWSVKLVRLNSAAEGDERTRDEIEGRVPLW